MSTIRHISDAKPGDRVRVSHIRGEPSAYWDHAFDGVVESVDGGPSYAPELTVRRDDTGEEKSVQPSGLTSVRLID